MSQSYTEYMRSEEEWGDVCIAFHEKLDEFAKSFPTELDKQVIIELLEVELIQQREEVLQ